MAVFGAPVALEDHALRACPAALEIQRAVQGIAAENDRQDGVSLLLRVGLNAGQVIAGEFGSAAIGYTAIGEQVGMAQRMESAVPPGGVMLSDSTAQLVGRVVILGEPEMVSIKGADAPVPARLLLGVERMLQGLVEELRELCPPVGDNTSLAIGLTALALQHAFHGQMREAIQLALEQMSLLESIGEPTSTIGAASAAAWILNEAGQSAETLRWAQNVIEWAGGESVIRDSPVRPSPLIALALVFRGVVRWRLGHDEWREDLDGAVAIARNADPITDPCGRFVDVPWTRFLTGCCGRDANVVPRARACAAHCRSNGGEHLCGKRQIHAYSACLRSERYPPNAGAVWRC